MAVRTAYAPVAGEVLTAANMTKLPGGWLGYVEILADSAAIGTSLTDVTGLTVTVTVGTSRRIRVSAYTPTAQSTSAGLTTVTLREGATSLTSSYIDLGTNAYGTHVPSVVLTPSAGSHTYKVSMVTSANTFRVIGAATEPAYIMVEDLGPAA